MAELTQAELESKISAIDTQIAVIYSSPTGMADYRIGQKSVTSSQILDGLLKAREMYQKILDNYPTESYQRMAISTSDRGEDESEYLGETGLGESGE